MSAPDRVWFNSASHANTVAAWGGNPPYGCVEYTRADLVPQWRPIETAPKETEVLVWGNGQSGVYLAINNGEWWVADVHPYEWTELTVTPTHWMPLPNPPEDK